MLIYAGETDTLPENEPVREGYTFSCWEDEYGNQYCAGDSYSIPHDGAVLTAVWEESVYYTITYNLNGGIGTFATQSAKITDTIIIHSGKPTRDGCEFVFWQSTDSKTYLPGGIYDNMISTELIAIWNCSVSYNLNGGIGNISKQYGLNTTSIYLCVDIPQKDGYAFVAWIDECKNEYYPGDLISLENGSVILTAVWEFTGYIISYDLNGGTGTFANQIKQYDIDIALHENKPTRSGYDFLCWEGKSTDAFFVPSDLYNVNQSEVMVAQWEEKVPITSVVVTPERKTIGLNETITLDVMVYPDDSSSKTVYWRSNNKSVATVGKYTGIVKPQKRGVTTITATSSDGKVTDTCIITVNDREKVVVIKEGDYFSINFSNGLVWKSIGCDLQLEKNRSGEEMWDPSKYDFLNYQEQRYIYNLAQQDEYEDFSVEQLAFIYRFDPLGIQYYMINDARRNCGTRALCKFKDEVYIAIFGEQVPGKFEFKKDNYTGKLNYGVYSSFLNREDYFTNAEILFGFHTIFDWDYFKESLITGLFSTIPFVSNVLTGVEVYQALFHSASIVGLSSTSTSSYVEDYVNQKIEDKINKKLGNNAKKAISLANNLLFLLMDIPFTAMDSFSIPNANDIKIYNKIKEQDKYRVIFNYDSKSLSMEEIIELCNNTNRIT